jgi:hypothetical protein
MCVTCGTSSCSGCQEEAISIDQVCNPTVCATEECVDSYLAKCVFVTGDSISCGQDVVVATGLNVEEALDAVVQYYCTEIAALKEQIASLTARVLVLETP